ncbi:MAG: mCpol domain-containing protein [Bacteroidota bacterium]
MFAFFDGDNIGDTIKRSLLEGNVDSARETSKRITSSLKEIEIFIDNYPEIEIIIIGGDDLLIKYPEETYAYKLLEEIRAIFSENMNHQNTFSCGVGKSIEEAIQNLDKAKLFGKNQIFPYKDIK